MNFRTKRIQGQNFVSWIRRPIIILTPFGHVCLDWIHERNLCNLESFVRCFPIVGSESTDNQYL